MIRPVVQRFCRVWTQQAVILQSLHLHLNREADERIVLPFLFDRCFFLESASRFYGHEILKVLSCDRVCGTACGIEQTLHFFRP